MGSALLRPECKIDKGGTAPRTSVNSAFPDTAQPLTPETTKEATRTAASEGTAKLPLPQSSGLLNRKLNLGHVVGRITIFLILQVDFPDRIGDPVAVVFKPGKSSLVCLKQIIKTAMMHDAGHLLFWQFVDFHRFAFRKRPFNRYSRLYIRIRGSVKGFPGSPLQNPYRASR